MRRRRAVRGALLAVVLAAGVILGLLGMHTLDGHGAGHGGAAVAAHAQVGAMADAASSDAEHASTGSSPHSPSTATVVAPVAALFALVPQPHDPSGAAGVGLTCVLALLAGLLLLTLPRSGLPFAGTPQASAPPFRRTASPTRPVSLHELCISRR